MSNSFIKTYIQNKSSYLNNNTTTGVKLRTPIAAYETPAYQNIYPSGLFYILKI